MRNLALALVAIALTGVGCGELTIRTWVNVIEEESGGVVDVNGSLFDIIRLQGGFLTETKLDTRQILGTMEGTIELLDVRMAGEVEGFIGKLCTWGNYPGESGGSMRMNALQGTLESDLYLDALAATEISDSLDLGPIPFQEQVDFDLGANFDLAKFTTGYVNGSTNGLFQTSTQISSEMLLFGIPAVFTMDTTVDSGALPPAFDEDLLDYCGERFAQQKFGEALYYGINPQSSYLRHLNNDRPKDPLVISLAEIGAEVGDTLRMKPHGSYSFLFLGMDGVDRRLGGTFSQNDTILESSQLWRIPAAVPSSAPKLNTWLSLFCIFGTCEDLGGDDTFHDFAIDPLRIVVVPPFAKYLVVAPVDTWRNYSDNSGLGFGVTVEVIPQ